MSQITLVTNQHDDDVGIGMISQFLKPSGHIVVRLMLADIVHEERTDCASVVCGCDCSVAFLSGGIPDLGLR